MNRCQEDRFDDGRRAETTLAESGPQIGLRRGTILISGRDTDSSTIYRYTAAGGLRPWIGGKASQHMMVFDVGSRSYLPYQAGINGVEILGSDLYYTTLYNKGPASYEKRSRSDTADTGISFGEVRKVIGGATDPSGRDVLLADLGQAEIRLGNPDGVVYPVADGFGHHAGEPVYAMNPYGLLPRGGSVWSPTPRPTTSSASTRRPARSTWSPSSPTACRRRRRCPSRSLRVPATGST